MVNICASRISKFYLDKLSLFQCVPLGLVILVQVAHIGPVVDLQSPGPCSAKPSELLAHRVEFKISD